MYLQSPVPPFLETSLPADWIIQSWVDFGNSELHIHWLNKQMFVSVFREEVIMFTLWSRKVQHENASQSCRRTNTPTAGSGFPSTNFSQCCRLWVIEKCSGNASSEFCVSNLSWIFGRMSELLLKVLLRWSVHKKTCRQLTLNFWKSQGKRSLTESFYNCMSSTTLN